MEGKGEVTAEGSSYLEVDEGRYLAYDVESGEYYLSNHPQPIKGGKPARSSSWLGVRRFIIDDGTADYYYKVAVGVVVNNDWEVWVAGDRIKGEEVEEAADAKVLFIPPFVMKYPRNKSEEISRAKIYFKEFWIRVKAQMVKAGYMNEDDEDDELPQDDDFYIKLRDKARNRQVEETHNMDHDMEDSGDDDEDDDDDDEDEDEDEDDDDDDDEDGDDDDYDEDDEEDDGEDGESHEDNDFYTSDFDFGNGQVKETHYMDQDMEDSEGMPGAVTSDMKQLNLDTTYCRDMNGANIRDIELLYSK